MRQLKILGQAGFARSMNIAKLTAAVAFGAATALAQRPGVSGVAGGAGKNPCRSPLRCERLLALSKARSLGELTTAYRKGCTGYPEQAVRALRAYQLGAPGRVHALLDSAPTRFGDVMSLLYVTAAPNPVSSDDFRGFFDTRGPLDVIPNGCGDFDSRRTQAIFTKYLAALAGAMPSHPQSFPRFLAASQLFGRAALWRSMNAEGGYSPVDPLAVFGTLLRSLYKRDPAAFRRAARLTKFGPAALKVATSPPPKKSASDAPCSCSPRRKGRS
jgi:hypothetical protein